MNLSQALDYFHIQSLEGYTFETLKSDYKKLAKIYHPDTNNGNHESFVKLRQAYHIISEELSQHYVEKQKTNTSYRSAMYSDKDADIQVQLKILYGEAQNASIESKEKFEHLWNEFSIKREELLKKMEHDLDSLKKRTSVFSHMFFWKRDSMIRKNLDYQIKLNEYQQKLYDLDTSYLKEVVKLYADVLNHLNHIVIPESES